MASVLPWPVKLKQRFRESWVCKTMSWRLKTACKIQFKNQDNLILIKIWTRYWISRPSWGPDWQCNFDYVFYPFIYHRVFLQAFWALCGKRCAITPANSVLWSSLSNQAYGSVSVYCLWSDYCQSHFLHISIDLKRGELLYTADNVSFMCFYGFFKQPVNEHCNINMHFPQYV